MLIEQESGIDAARIRAWLDTQPLSELNCQFTIEELEPRVLGAMSLPRCLVRISGDEDSCSELYRRFFLAFMSAGG